MKRTTTKKVLNIIQGVPQTVFHLNVVSCHNSSRSTGLCLSLLFSRRATEAETTMSSEIPFFALMSRIRYLFVTPICKH